MIINNTGLNARGALGHIELDSVTFERGKPQPINMEGAPKYVASEMCEVLGEHWGYAEKDFKFKSLKELIEELASCRKYGSNFLLNVGPMADGSLRPLDKALLETLGHWVKMNDEALRIPRPTNVVVEDKAEDFILQNGDVYYIFCHNIPMELNANVVLYAEGNNLEKFAFDKKIKRVEWLDNGEELEFSQEDGKVVITCNPYPYGENLVVRIAKVYV